MTKNDIVREISESMDIPQTLVKRIVQATLDGIVGTLSRDGRIELRNFGIFEAKYRKSRKARNPLTNRTLKTKAKFAVTFKPGKQMAKMVHNAQIKAAAKKSGE